MLKILNSIVIAISLEAGISLAEESGAAEEPEPDFSELITKDGQIFRSCFVQRAESDALVVRHEEGIASISFFDLGPEIQRRYDFDPVAALQDYQARIARERRNRQTRLLENERARAEAMQIEAENERYEIAREKWYPVEATVTARANGGLYVTASRITLVETTITSALGFENEGPMRKKRIPFRPSAIFLPGAESKDSRWKGYVEPFSTKSVPGPLGGPAMTPAHRSIALRE